MGCCGDKKVRNSRQVAEEIQVIQGLLAEALVRTQNILPKISCTRCVNRIRFLIEGLEIFSRMNIFADAYRETTDKWRSWITRMFESEIAPISQLIAAQTQKNPEKQEQEEQTQ